MSKSQKHILRYGTNAEQKYIDDLSNSFDLLALNGNMLAFTPGAIASFIMMHFLQCENKGFFIDPITHAFQHGIDKISSFSEKDQKKVIKKSIANLIECYGEPIKSNIFENRVIIPEYFLSSTLKESFCRNVIDFQLSTITSHLEKKGFLDYLGSMQGVLEKLVPSFIIPPYFYVTESYDKEEDWLPLNIDFINIAKKAFPDKKIYAQLVVSKDILGSFSFRNKVCEAYINANPEGILLWIDDFCEHNVSYESLKNYISIIKSFKTRGIKVYNLYGGFFSIILTGFSDELGFELDGVGHGLEYGEYRSVVPVGGGIPTSKYYYYPLHNRLDYKTASELLSLLGYFKCSPSKGAEMYYQKICSCYSCKSVIQDNINNFSKFENTEFYEMMLRGTKQRRSYASQDTKEICIKHYQYKKEQEFEDVATAADKDSLQHFLQHLESTYLYYKKLGSLSLESIAYLKNWYQVLRNEIGA